MVTTSWKGFKPSSETSSRVGRGNKGRDTAPEILLRRELWRCGIRFRAHALELPGKPDIVLRAKRIVIFCDGDFWHGRDWESRRRRLARGANASYWVNKIARNIARDRQVTRDLSQSGWKVIRVWESDVLKAPIEVARRVARRIVDHDR